MAAATMNTPAGRASAMTGRPSDPAAERTKGGTGHRPDVFRKAQHHSRRVRFLKFVLPVLALALAGGFVAYSWWSTPAQVSFDVTKSSFADGKLVMANPKLEGFTKGQLPYLMTAARAVQNAKSSGVFELDTIKAKLPLDADSWATIEAPRGVYNRDKNTIHFTTDVLIKTTDGMTAKFSKALFDIGKGNLKTNAPVDIETNGTQIAADSMTVLENGKVLIFEKRVRMEIAPGRLQTSQGTTGETNGG
ncbi:LPS export ABC transporter periplasmic protein LptC [Mesorhizobium sp. L-8-3]|uniref:LPS export ABC transporter periplasmic protein LptC n=1 Tax=Mesorhizobium sp. L-8-3 TaxID=2744522 RepID=UPI001FD05963|nr:LPS export ABC transporter periplasmic protein LptC [Mesorhizobium sp. L-8-3]